MLKMDTWSVVLATLLPILIVAVVVVLIVFIVGRRGKSNPDSVFGLYKSQMKANAEMMQNMADMTKGTTGAQKIDMDTSGIFENVIFYFDGHMYSRMVGFCHLRVDDKEPTKVFPGMPIGLELDPGTHTFFATYPKDNNEVYPARTQIEVAPNKRYQIIYKFPTTKLTPSQIFVEEIN